MTQLFLYCERGLDPAFWAEPFNAVSNMAFIIAAVAAAVRLRFVASAAPMSMERLLIGLVGLVGVASFLFHTTAARWAFAMDSGTIAVLAVCYLGYAVRRFLQASWPATLVGLSALGASLILVPRMGCPFSSDLLPITAAVGHACFNGSLGYVPVVIAMFAVGALVGVRRGAPAPLILGAALVFTASLGARTLDWELCEGYGLIGRARGTHALWHVLNALALYLLLRAAVDYGGTVGGHGANGNPPSKFGVQPY